MPATQNDDKVWFDSRTKLREICNEVQLESSHGNNILVLAHFPATLSDLRRLLAERDIECLDFSLYDSFRLCSAAAKTVWLGLARAFQAPVKSAATSVPTQLRILVAEHHPKQSRDQELLETAAKLPCDAQVCFLFSLDDPLLEHFGALSIRQLFQQLGMAETDCITHPLVTSAIRNAQEKIEEQVPRDVETQSIADWFKYNLHKQ